jgi:Skp family chaperone for outer membrane proteins
MTRAIWLTTLIGAVAGVTLLAPARAAAPAGEWGVVDTERVAADYEGMVELNVQFQQFQREQETELERQHKTRMLSDDERREYLDLIEMGAPTPERDARILELGGLSDDREQKLLDLRENESRTPEEEADYTGLNQLYQTRVKELADLQLRAQQAVRAKLEEFNKIVTDNVQQAVEAVAEEKQLSIVIRKDAVLHGGVDITDDVLARLNASQQEETETPS